MKNAIACVSPKSKTVVNITSLNNRISCVAGIPIFGFKKYWQIFFNFLELNTRPTFKQFFQAKTVNAEKKSYYQQCYVKITRDFHKQAMMKQKIYENKLTSRSGMDYSPGIQFETSISNMDEEKSLTTSNQTKESNHKQQKQCWCGSIKKL